jgi:hypothetical protein
MGPKADDIEFERAGLRRWQQEVARQDSRVLQTAWHAIVRSHTLLDRPVYTATRQCPPDAAGPRPPGEKEP